MDPKELFKQSLAQTERCIRHIEPRQLEKSTPCSDWNLRQLVNHMVYEMLWIPEIVAGKTIAEVGDRFDGDLLGNDIQAAWDRASHGALAAIEQADLRKKAHLSYGDVSVASYINEAAGDILLHGWDADQSMNCNMIIDPKLVQAVYDDMLPKKDQLAKSGLYGTPVTVPEDASIQTKLLALVGRKAT